MRMIKGSLPEGCSLSPNGGGHINIMTGGKLLFLRLDKSDDGIRMRTFAGSWVSQHTARQKRFFDANMYISLVENLGGQWTELEGHDSRVIEVTGLAGERITAEISQFLPPTLNCE